MMRAIPRTIKLPMAGEAAKGADSFFQGTISSEHRAVFDFLLQVNREYQLNATLRVAGGWVRDTILGQHSNDIDIAIQSSPNHVVSGEQFARAVSDFQSSRNERARTVSVIRVNPELSKHIETATVCVCDLPVEFCALRTDDYCDDSRIPQVRYAEPSEDAHRRDYTVNALFYNLHTEEVEDYTTGFDDLTSRTLRCPLDPQKTFSDDPLRLLRGVRFVGQLGDFGFELDPSVLHCVTPELLGILQRKVSRERIGKEFWKMMACSHAEKCVAVLLRLGLLQEILLSAIHVKRTSKKKAGTMEVESVTSFNERTGDQSAAIADRVARLTRAALPTLLHLNPSCCFAFLEDEVRVAYMCFELLIPELRGLSTTPDVVEERVYDICVNGLKTPVSIHHAVRRMVDSYNALKSQDFTLAEALSFPTADDATKIKVMESLAPLNDKHVPQGAYCLTLLCYLLQECRPDLIDGEVEVDKIADFFSPIWASLEACPKLLNVFAMPTPVDGKQLKELLGLENSQISLALLLLRRQIVLHPEETDVSVLVNYVRQALP